MYSKYKNEKICLLKIKIICNGTRKVIQEFKGNDAVSQNLKVFKMNLCLYELFN